MSKSQKNFQAIQTHLQQMGFIYQGSQIYGGLANTWDYGPLGTMLMKKIKDLWYREFILKEARNFLIDTKILMNPQVWVASGHVDTFVDPLIENKENGKRYRADHIIEELFPDVKVDSMNNQELELFLNKHVTYYDHAQCSWGKIKNFNLMFQTSQGVIQEQKNQLYLRPETAQGIFINFKNVQRSMRAKLPFGIGQIGKSFRNEVTPGNYIFRTREFEQMELEYFVHEKASMEAYEYYVKKAFNFAKLLGLSDQQLTLRVHHKQELAHYAQKTTDVEFMFPFGKGEIMGIAHRSNFDLKTHMKHSGESLDYLDPITNDKIIPNVIEPSMGLDRLTLAVLVDAYHVDELEHDSRIVLKIDPKLAPYQVAVLPLSKKHHQASGQVVFNKLTEQNIIATYDSGGSIGKRYRRQDAIGTPLIITIIDQTEKDQTVTIRFRDSMEQKTIKLADLAQYLPK